MHKDLSEDGRGASEAAGAAVVLYLRDNGDHESLAIAREAMINAFDEAATNAVA